MPQTGSMGSVEVMNDGLPWGAYRRARPSTDYDAYFRFEDRPVLRDVLLDVLREVLRPAARFPERIETSTCHPGFRGIVRPPSAARSEVDRQSS